MMCHNVRYQFLGKQFLITLLFIMLYGRGNLFQVLPNVIVSVTDPLLLSGFYCAHEGSFLSNRFQYFFYCLMVCPADSPFFSKSTFQKPQVFLYLLSSLSMFLLHTAPHSISVSLSPVSSMFCLLFLSKVLSSLRMLLFLLLFFF